MYWIKKWKRSIIMIIIGCATLTFLCLLQYGIHFYFEPVKEDFHLAADGILIYSVSPVGHKAVSVELTGEKLYYLFVNNPSGFQGNVRLNETRLFGYDDIEVYIEFHEASEYGCTYAMNNETPGKMITLQKDMEAMICGIDLNANKKSVNFPPKPALLVVPASEMTTANAIIKEALSYSPAFSDWLSENGWKQYAE